jgi:uracil-DNA glycosylase
MTFCDFNSLFGNNANQFYVIISNYFNQLPISTLKDFYNDFRNNFMTHPPLHPDGCIFHPRGMYNAPQNRKTAYNQSKLVGIDLPSSLTNEHNDQKVMIIGEDPIRDPKVFGAQRPYDLIGTPFGFHNHNIRNKKRPTYFNIVQGLINKGYNVYCTDVFKIWIQDPNKNQNQKVNMNPELPNAIPLLMNEIDLLQPHYILLMGVRVQNIVSNLNINSNVQIKNVPHPSTSANGKWTEILGSGSTLNDRVQYIVNLFP